MTLINKKPVLNLTRAENETLIKFMMIIEDWYDITNQDIDNCGLLEILDAIRNEQKENEFCIIKVEE